MKSIPFLSCAMLVGISSIAVADAPVGPTAAPPPPKLILPLPSSTAGTVLTDRESYASGAPVRIHFIVKNDSPSSVRYEFSTAQQFDVSVNDATGATVWQWSLGKTFKPAAGNLTLKRGKFHTYDVIWNGRTNAGMTPPPGTYTIDARLVSSPRAAITGGFAIDTDTDPTNSGLPRPETDTGAVRAIDTAPPVFGTTKITLR